MSSALRAVVSLVLCCASLMVLAYQLGSETAVSYATTNFLPFVWRKALVESLLGIALVVGVAGAFALKAGPRGHRALRLTASVASPLMVAAFIPALCKRGVWEPLPTVIVIGAVVLLFEVLLRRSLNAMAELAGDTGARMNMPADRNAKRWGAICVCGAALFYTLYMSRYTVFAHRRFVTSNFDLGQYDNIFWSALHGHPLRCSPLGAVTDWSEMGGHADLSIYFLLPFYSLRPHPETLLIIQSAMIALGAIPIYLFAARRLPASYAAGLALAYLLWPPVHGANFYDFHLQPIAATFVLYTIYFVDVQRRTLALLFFTMALGCREDTSVGLAMLGTFYLLSGYRPRAGLAMALSSTVYFAIMRFGIMPQFGTGWFSEIYRQLYPRPDGPQSYGGVILTLITNPVYALRTTLTEAKLTYLLEILTPLAFLPLRSAVLLPALGPGILFTVMTTAYPPTTDIAFQYSGHFTPYIFTASAVVLGSRANDQQKAAVVALCLSVWLCALQWGAFPRPGSVRGGFQVVTFSPPTAADEQKHRDLRELVAMVPELAGVAVSEEELPHVADRLDVYTLKYGIDVPKTGYILYGLSSGGASVAAKTLEDGTYVEVATRTGLALLKRKN